MIEFLGINKVTELIIGKDLCLGITRVLISFMRISKILIESAGNMPFSKKLSRFETTFV